MSLGHNASIVKNGLIFYLDNLNKKSYKGPLISNLWKYNAPVYTGTYTGAEFNYSEVTVDIPQIGKVISQKCRLYNDYNNTSSICCPIIFRTSYHSAINGTSVSPSTLYTYGIIYKTTSGYTHPNFMYRYEYDASNNKQTEGGVHSTARRIHLGDGWYWAWGTFTTQPNTVIINTAGSFYYRWGTDYDDFYVAKYLLVEGDYQYLHPRYWPDLNITRSNTESLLDLTGKNTVTVNSLTYNSNNLYEFNGTSDYIDLPNDIGYTSQVSAFGWFKSAGTPAGNYHIILGGQELEISIYTTGYLRTGIFQGSRYVHNHGSGLTDGNWHQVGFTFDGSTKVAYIDGVSVGTDSIPSGTLTSSFSNRKIGRFGSSGTYYVNGEISQVKIYNKALTAEEVQKNFVALRGRYGI